MAEPITTLGRASALFVATSYLVDRVVLSLPTLARDGMLAHLDRVAAAARIGDAEKDGVVINR
jgi:hypothetical protein